MSSISPDDVSVSSSWHHARVIPASPSASTLTRPASSSTGSMSPSVSMQKESSSLPSSRPRPRRASMSAANSLSSASVGPKLAWPSGKNWSGGVVAVVVVMDGFVGFSTAPSSLQQDTAAAASSRGGGEQNSERAGSKMGTRYSSCSCSSTISPSSFRSSGESPPLPAAASGTTTSRLDSSCPKAAALLAACDRGVRALRLNHAAGTASSRRPDPDGGTSGGGDDGRSRSRSWRRASGFAECTDVSHPWHRNASSAAQYHLARRRRQPSHARADLAPTAPAAAAFAVLLIYHSSSSSSFSPRVVSC
ncbi:Os06g0263801, partial [Oryza sativa Japonica Group]